jgi:ribosome-associated protein
VYDTARLPSMFERVVIASGDSTRQVKALADHVQEKVRESGAPVYGVEGEAAGEWVLVDLGDIVVHLMHPTVREFYNLEEVWGGKRVRLSKKAAALAKAAKKRGTASRPRRKR